MMRNEVKIIVSWLRQVLTDTRAAASFVAGVVTQLLNLLFPSIQIPSWVSYAFWVLGFILGNYGTVRDTLKAKGPQPLRPAPNHGSR